MSTAPTVRLLSSPRSFSKAASAGAILLGCLGLVGLVLDLPVLKSVHPGWVTMKANTALALILAGGALGLLITRPVSPRRHRLALAAACLVSLLGGLTLTEDLLGWDLGIDQVLVQDERGAVGTGAPGRMAPATALGFILLGAALLLLDRPRGARIAQGCALTVGTIGLLHLLGYAYSLPALTGFAATTRMAVNTAAALFLLSLGVLSARPEVGVVATITSTGAGGLLARRLLPAALGLPVLLGGLKVLGARAGLWEMELGTGLLALSSVLVLTALVWWTAGVVSRSEATQRRAEVALRDSEQRYQTIARMSPVGIFRTDAAGDCLYVNERWCEIAGLTREEARGRGWVHGLHPDDRPRISAEWYRTAEEKVPFALEYRFRRPDDRTTWVLGQAAAESGPDGTLVGYVGTITDITQRKEAEEALDKAYGQLEQLIHARTAELRAANESLQGEIAERKRAEEALQVRARQQAAVAELGQRALTGVEVPALMDEAVAVVARTLAVEFCKVLELLPDGNALLLRAGVGWKGGSVGQATVGAGTDSQAGYTLLSSTPVIVEDLRTESRFSGPQVLHDHGVVSGLSVIIPGRDRPFGVLGAHTTSPRAFSQDDVHFVQAVANVLAETIGRKQVEEVRARLLERIILAQEEERRRVARELHDGAGQSLTSLLLGLQAMERLGSGEEVKARVVSLRSLVGNILDEIDHVVRFLRPSILDDLGLVVALERFVKAYEATTGLHVDFVTQGLEGTRLSPTLETTLYRIVQEAVTNVVKHAEARHASVLIERRGNTVIAVVEDDGRGFDAAGARQLQGHTGGFGLLSMEERASMLRGTFTVESRPGAGTTIVVKLPLDILEPG